MLTNNIFKLHNIILIRNCLKANHRFIKLLVKSGIFIQYICDSTAHTCCKVLTCFTKYDNSTTCHIFTAMVTYALYYSCCTRVSYSKTLTCNSIYKCLTAGSAIQCHISDDDVLILLIGSPLFWIYDKLTA